MSERLADVLASFARHLGMRLVYRPRYGHLEEMPTWNGADLDVAGFDDPSDLAHEIAHLLLAAPERRRLPNFGLGPDYPAGPGTRSVSDARVREEEVSASVLGICLIREAGGDWQAAAVRHGWMGEDGMSADPWNALVHEIEPHVTDFARFMASRERSELHQVPEEEPR